MEVKMISLTVQRLMEEPLIIDHNWIGLLMPTKSNKTQSLNAMGNPHYSRRNRLKNYSSTITDIIMYYPPLLSFDGEVLIEEF
ncbi:Insulin-degrading enzyme [Frankliniella fusca]|uniref:Insulin-degrading enzyme n=1 Tax=Frankliniella fusca TaxID=407009 RepID=A0AAE1H915_9NEOP|nr:Insulin-degrading enzyme [Frankliniella fusca]